MPGWCHLELLKQAQGELLFGGIERMGRWFRGALRFGDTLLFEGLFLLIPGTELGSRLIEGKPDGDGDFRGHQHEKDQALPPEIAPTFLIAQFVEMRERMRGFRAWVVRIVDDEAARGDAMVVQDHPHAGHQEIIPGNLAVAKHPR